ncbi:signal peptide peptidase SppA [Siphonobacter sp. SORGH_AS_0500]|uniref:signal peptide peptidase SppA n=1 Tax=Siphonobacter sp. SORGH_AS_0500 TaxID=1864824 RepID=UPI000CAED2C7|nr:signal peptide peptidase SppA [Siphonobacter sp. SORGH_AS_0500]PKK37014.1 signal peptide peptidase SppA [Siphonobacter sp. SORGH_AS_0500]
MLQFLKYVLATIVGLLLFSVVAFFLIIGIASVVGSASESVTLDDNSVLKLDLNKSFTEHDNVSNPLSDFSGPFISNKSQVGVVQLKQALAYAKTDSKIKGIYLKANSPSTGWAVLEEVRNALIDFKKSGKFVYSYGETYTEQGYYLSSVADKIYLNPSGGIDFNGLNAEYEFYKGTFDKLDIKPVVFRVGNYKSAVEPFLRENMSEENREQTKSFLNSIYNQVLDEVSKSRGVSVAELKTIADSLKAYEPTDALKNKIVTNVGYYDEFDTAIRKALKINEDQKVNYVNLDKYQKTISADKDAPNTDNKIAVIVAEGSIVDGSDDSDGQIASEKTAAEIRKARKDKNVKAIVLRINSPGGSGLASEVMWREIQLAREKKPVIASMSNYAASGGYYLAMGCNKIVAQPTTITGSIGVFSLFFRVDEFTKNKLGITFDRVNTNAHSDYPTLTREMDDFEKAHFQRSTDRFYEVFTNKAAQGRKMPVEKLRALAGGRVWSGLEGKQNGLVDELGGLDKAISLAASEAKLKSGEYRVRYPAKKEFFETLFDTVDAEQEARLLNSTFGDLVPYVQKLKKLQTMNGLQARLPYEINIR